MKHNEARVKLIGTGKCMLTMVEAIKEERCLGDVYTSLCGEDSNI